MNKLPETIHESWHPYLQFLFDDKKMEMMRTGILVNDPFYPAPTDIFNVFKMPLDKIKVVILGQDPYSKGEAIGYSFAVSKATPLPRSLRIIKEEIINSKVERDSHTNIDSDSWKTLQHWRQQGIFLLNAALTVEKLNPDSHTNTWHWFTREVIKIISNKVGPIWLMWGSKAKAFNTYVIEAGYPWKKDLGHNLIFEAAHPAAETYPNAKVKFTGCNHFNLCNRELKKSNKTIINW